MAIEDRVMKKLLSALIVLLLTASLAQAQWQVPNNAIPVGRGTGVVGFKYALGSGGFGLNCLVDSTPPSFASCPGGGGGGSGTVTSFTFTNGSGFSGSVTNSTTTPTLALTTSISGVLKGSAGTLALAVSGTDYQAPLTLTTTGSSGAATLVGTTLNIPQYTGGGSGTAFKQNFIAGTNFTSGTTTTLTLTTTPSSGVAVLVSFDGVEQTGGTGTTGDAWTISTNVITFSAPITALHVVQVVGLSSSGGSGGSGTVTTASVVSANGFAGTVANPTTTPAITLSTTASGVLKGNGTAISAATAGTDYQAPITLTTTGTSGAATFAANTLNIPQYTGGGGGSSFGYIYDATSASTGAGTDGNICAMRTGASSANNASSLNLCLSAHTAVGIPAGRYMMCGATITANGMSIYGAGIDATVLICDSATGNMITVGANLFNISGLWLDRCTNTGCGTVVTSTSGAGIGYTGASMGCNLCTVRDIVSENQWNGFALPPAAAGVLENLTAQNNFNDGFYFTANSTYTGNQYSANGLLSQGNNHYGYNTDTGGLVSTGTTWMIANGISTYLNGAGGAYFFGTLGSSISDVQINGGFFSNDNNNLMAFIGAGAGSEHNILRGLLMEGGGRCAGGNCGRNSAFVAPSNNGSAIAVLTSGMEFIIENNAMRGNSSYGVYIDNGISRVIISGNAISQNAVHIAAYGIQITNASTTAIISNNMGVDYGSEVYGLYVGGGTNSIISGNAMGGSTAGCFVASGTAKGTGTNIGTGCP